MKKILGYFILLSPVNGFFIYLAFSLESVSKSLIILGITAGFTGIILGITWLGINLILRDVGD